MRGPHSIFPESFFHSWFLKTLLLTLWQNKTNLSLSGTIFLNKDCHLVWAPDNSKAPKEAVRSIWTSVFLILLSLEHKTLESSLQSAPSLYYRAQVIIPEFDLLFPSTFPTTPILSLADFQFLALVWVHGQHFSMASTNTSHLDSLSHVLPST